MNDRALRGEPLRGCLRAALLASFMCAAHGLAEAQTTQDARPQATQPQVVSPVVGPLNGADVLGQTAADSGYRIGAGDVLNVQIYNRPQLSREAVRVDGRGMIRMPWIDEEIRAACRTEAEVAADITTRYHRLLRNPQVGVFIKEYQSQPVAVIGAVNQPGRFQLQRRVRLLELLTFAGGPAERAGRSVQIIHASQTNLCAQPDEVTAPSGDGINATPVDVPASGEGESTSVAASSPTPETGRDAAVGEESLTSFSLRDVMRGDVRANPDVRPGDIVTIPDADQVFVVGNVLKPSTLTLRETLTVSQAVAMAGGLLPDSRTERVRVVRQTADGKTEIFVDLKAVEKRRAEDVALQANDIVDVPTAGGKRFLRGILSAVAPAVGQLPVRVIP